jgi:hypothetical protein
VSDLKLGNKITVLSDADGLVASVAAPRVEEETEDEDAAKEPEVITEKPSEE